MAKAIATLTLSLSLALGIAIPAVSVAVPLQRRDLTEIPSDSQITDLLGLDDQLWNRADGQRQRQALLRAIAYSLRYLRTSAAAEAYRQYPVPGITRARVRRSLQRFRELVLDSNSPAELQAAVLREFDLYQSVGNDGAGTVAFTGYFEPTYAASRMPTAEFRYPLYRTPPGLGQWPHPHPTRLQLEGADGLQASQGPLRGLELVWLRDRLEAFL
ncbi:MAG TPA: MltA domain-containing protein, partial [Crinalium sp.]